MTTHLDVYITIKCAQNNALGLEQEFHLDVLYRQLVYVAVNTDKTLFEGDAFVGVGDSPRAAATDFIQQWVGLT